MTTEFRLNAEGFTSEHLLEISHLVETKIDHELNLINHRITWLATSQAFLFVAAATIFAAPHPFEHYAVVGLLTVIVAVGMIMSFVVHTAVQSALKVLTDHLLSERAALTSELNRRSNNTFALLGPDRITEDHGARPAKSIPLTFFVSWIFVGICLVWYVVRP